MNVTPIRSYNSRKRRRISSNVNILEQIDNDLLENPLPPIQSAPSDGSYELLYLYRYQNEKLRKLLELLDDL